MLNDIHIDNDLFGGKDPSRALTSALRNSQGHGYARRFFTKISRGVERVSPLDAVPN